MNTAQPLHNIKEKQFSVTSIHMERDLIQNVPDDKFPLLSLNIIDLSLTFDL